MNVNMAVVTEISCTYLLRLAVGFAQLYHFITLECAFWQCEWKMLFRRMQTNRTNLKMGS